MLCYVMTLRRPALCTLVHFGVNPCEPYPSMASPTVVGLQPEEWARAAVGGALSEALAEAAVVDSPL